MIGATTYIDGVEYMIDKDKSSRYQEDVYGYMEVDAEPCPICFRMLKNAGVEKIINRRGEVWM